MRSLRFFTCLLTLISVIPTLSAQPQPVMDIGTAIRSDDGSLPIAFESSNPTVLTLGQRAFAIHGGFTRTHANQAAFTFRVEPVGATAVRLSIESGRPAKTLLQETISGADLQDAALRAFDRAVLATLRTPGFFAGKLAFVGKQRGISEIYISDLLFNRVRPLTTDRSLVTGPSWSPDGRKLLYTTYYKTGFPDIYLIDVQTRAKTPIATFKGTNSGGAFSPDGRQIAMTLSGTGNAEIYVTDSLGRNARRLTNNKSLEASPSWSPDGRRLVYESDAPGRPHLFEVAAAGGPPRQIPTNISRFNSEPAWNPVNENLIAFTVASGNGFQIAVYDASTRESQVLTQVADSAVEPEWLSDGRHLIFTQRKSGRMSLKVLDTKTRKISDLHQPAFGDASAASFVY